MMTYHSRQPVPHGTKTALRRHRDRGQQPCETCQAGSSLRMAARTTPIGLVAAARLRELRNMGWCSADIADAAGLDPAVIIHVVPSCTRCPWYIALAVELAHRELSPWPPDPDAVDEVVIQRLLDGIPVTSTRRERMEAVRRMRAAGWSWNDMARTLGVHQRQVYRWAETLGLVGAKAAA